MANTLTFTGPSGASCYALLTDAAGRWWDGSGFAAYSAPAYASYAVAAAEAGASGVFTADLSALPAGTYTGLAKRRAGATPAESDGVVAGPAAVVVGPAAGDAYLSLTTLKAQLGVSGSALDAELTALLAGVEAAVAAYLGFDPTETAVTEILDGNGRQSLPLRRRPVASVAGVWVNPGANGRDSAFTAADFLTPGDGYFVKAPGGILVRTDGVWPAACHREPGRLASTSGANFGAVKVEYSVDNTGVLAAAKLAGYAEASAHYRVRGQGNTVATSESLNGYSISRAMLPAVAGAGAARFASPAAELLLRPFRRTAIAGL